MKPTPELLLAMGFERGTGHWPCETYVYEGNLWIHFDDEREYGHPFSADFPTAHAEETTIAQIVSVLCDLYWQKGTETV